MSVTVTTNLQKDALMSGALTALSPALIALDAFSTAYRDVPLMGKDAKMDVPFYPLESSGSKDFSQSAGYKFTDSYTEEVIEVAINKRKYQPISVDSATLSRSPQLDPEKIGYQKGRKLAQDVLNDILSVLKIANFGAAVFTGAATTFDFAALNGQVGAACDAAGWPNVARSAILNSAYYRALVTDLGDASKYASDNPVKRGVLENVAGFDVYNSTLPANGEHVVGVVALPSAVVVGFSPVEPARLDVVDYRTMTNEQGVTVEYREWFDPDADMLKTVLEVNYGYAVGEQAAAKLIVSA